MSIKPTNISIKENLIEVEYDDNQWSYKGNIVSMIKNTEKIVWEYETTANSLILKYDDENEKFTVSLDLKKPIVSSEKKSNDKMCKEIIEKITEARELEKKITELQNIINNNQKIMNENKNKIEELKKERKELNDQIDFFPILMKYENGLQLTIREKLDIVSKKIISAETLISNSTTNEIEEFIRNHENYLKNLITDKIIDINLKNKEKETLLEISMKKNGTFATFLLDRDIDITPSMKNDIKICGTIEMNDAYFNNAKRNGHIDLLKTLRKDICGPRLQKLVDQS